MVIDMNEKQYLEIAKKVNLSNFDDIMDYYQLTNGQLLWIIEFATKSNVSSIQKLSL